MSLTLSDCLVDTPMTIQARAVLDARAAAWQRRVDEAAYRGETPVLMDMDALAKKSAAEAHPSPTPADGEAGS